MNDMDQGPLGDVVAHKGKREPRTPGSLPPEKVEDRPMVSQVTPESYPEADREASAPEGSKGDKAPTRTQPNPNISTEHQKPGDARKPRDVLDRDDAKRDPRSGGTIPDDYDPNAGR